jgi:hypothetical protein
MAQSSRFKGCTLIYVCKTFPGSRFDTSIRALQVFDGSIEAKPCHPSVTPNNEGSNTTPKAGISMIIFQTLEQNTLL